MVAPNSYRCRNHPDRAAIGVCVTCSAPVCADCTTKISGINHCLGCLARRAKAAETTVRRPSRMAVPLGVAAAFLFFAAVFAALGAAFIVT